jgi:hypothetical protein
MKSKLAALLRLAVIGIAPVALFATTGCAMRVAPFDQMDRAQMTVLRLSSQAPQPQAVLPQIPGLPAVPPEFQQMGQAAIGALQNVLPGLIPGAGAIPGMPGPQQQVPQFKGFSIVGQMPLADPALREQILDVFGRESSFSAQAQPCFSPGMGIVITRPDGPEIDLLISLSCNQAKMDGARWPHPVNGFTPETRDVLGKFYEKLFGPVPAGA